MYGTTEAYTTSDAGLKGTAPIYQDTIMLCAIFIGNTRIAHVQEARSSVKDRVCYIELERIVLEKKGSILGHINFEEEKDISIVYYENPSGGFKMGDNPKAKETFLLKNAHICEYNRESRVDEESRHWDVEIVRFVGRSLKFQDGVINEQQA